MNSASRLASSSYGETTFAWWSKVENFSESTSETDRPGVADLRDAFSAKGGSIAKAEDEK